MPDHRGVVGRAAADRLGARYGARVILHDTVDSTMAIAARDEGSRPVLHIAASQTAGRGRRGRDWSSPPGNLYATICWPDPDAALPPVLLAAIQVAWVEAVAGAGGPATRGKWPNDGLVGGQKWSGLLALRVNGPGGGELHIGLGANLTGAPVDVESAPYLPTTIAAHWPAFPGSEPVAGILLDAALTVLTGAPTSIPPLIARWPLQDALTYDDSITLETPTGNIAGRYRGISSDGRLRLDTPVGALEVSSGEVWHIRPRA